MRSHFAEGLSEDRPATVCAAPRVRWAPEAALRGRLGGERRDRRVLHAVDALQGDAPENGVPNVHIEP